LHFHPGALYLADVSPRRGAVAWNALPAGRAPARGGVVERKRDLSTRLLDWYRAGHRDLPWRRMRDPYAILVSEIMLQQTQVATVIPYYHEWLRQFPDFAALNRASENDILRAWQGLGYYTRARNLQATARAFVDRHGGRC